MSFESAIQNRIYYLMNDTLTIIIVYVFARANRPIDKSSSDSVQGHLLLFLKLHKLCKDWKEAGWRNLL